MTMVDSSDRYYVGHHPLSEVYLIHVSGLTFLPSSDGWLSLYWD